MFGIMPHGSECQPEEYSICSTLFKITIDGGAQVENWQATELLVMESRCMSMCAYCVEVQCLQWLGTASMILNCCDCGHIVLSGGGSPVEPIRTFCMFLNRVC